MSEMKLVPVEPTGAMVKAAMVYCHADRPGRASDIYRAMVEAAPAVSGGGLSEAVAHLETASRVLKNIPKPQEGDGSFVAYALSDDVPEDIYTARSYVDEALAIIRAGDYQAATPDGLQWQTMETAPDIHGCEVDLWLDSAERIADARGFQHNGVIVWHRLNDDGLHECIHGKATHWMPSPAAPLLAAPEGGK